MDTSPLFQDEYAKKGFLWKKTGFKVIKADIFYYFDNEEGRCQMVCVSRQVFCTG